MVMRNCMRKCRVLLGFFVLFLHCFFPFAQLCCAKMEFGDDILDEKQNHLINELGIAQGVIVTQGYLFVEGEYISPPYLIKRIGQYATINKKIINRRFLDDKSATNIQKQLQAPKESINDPEMPISITPDSCITDTALVGYLSKKKKYFYANYSEEIAMTKMVEVLRSLPCVSSVKADTRKLVEVHYKNGTVYAYETTLDLTAQNTIKNLKSLGDTAVEKMISLLESNKAVFLDSKNRNLIASHRNVPVVAILDEDELLRVFDIMMRTGSEAKIKGLADFEFGDVKVVQEKSSFLTKCMNSQALVSRIRKRKQELSVQETLKKNDTPILSNLTEKTVSIPNEINQDASSLSENMLHSDKLNNKLPCLVLMFAIGCLVLFVVGMWMILRKIASRGHRVPGKGQQ